MEWLIVGLMPWIMNDDSVNVSLSTDEVFHDIFCGLGFMCLCIGILLLLIFVLILCVSPAEHEHEQIQVQNDIGMIGGMSMCSLIFAIICYCLAWFVC